MQLCLAYIGHKQRWFRGGMRLLSCMLPNTAEQPRLQHLLQLRPQIKIKNAVRQFLISYPPNVGSGGKTCIYGFQSFCGVAGREEGVGYVNVASPWLQGNVAV